MPARIPATLRSWRDGYAALPPNLAASGLVILAYAIFTAMGVLAREAGRELPVTEIVFIRQLFAYLLMWPAFWRHRQEIAQSEQKHLHLLRGAAAVGGMFCGLTSVILIPFADSTAIQMAEVLFTTCAAGFVLGEIITPRRWIATGIGFVGVVVMVRPFSAGFDPASLIALLGAFFGSATVMTLRLSAGRDSTTTVLFYQGLVVLGFFLPFMPFVWIVPSIHTLAIIFAMGVVFVCGNWVFTVALRMGEASALTPLNYLRLMMMTIVGFCLYGEVPTMATVIGGVLVVGAATQTIRANATRKTILDAESSGS